MSKLREQLKRELFERNWDHSGWEYEHEEVQAKVSEDADRIIALVRGALLSNEVQAPIRHELHHYPRISTRDTVSTVIEMALDAVTGEDDER